jgi:hypothetical protein
MKLLQTAGGGTKKIYDVGDQVTYRNIWAPRGFIAQGTDKQSGASLIVSDFLEDGSSYIVKEVIPANVHKMHDLYRYVIAVMRNNQELDLILSEIYLR